MIITRTPFRLSFFGGGTDYNSWFEQHGGLVIAAAMSFYCYITVRRLPPFFENHTSRIVYSKIESVLKHEQIQHPSVRGCLKYLKVSDGVEIHHDGDLPARSGIGSSSSFTVGLLHALHGLGERMVDASRLATEAIDVEQRLLGESVGIQDQIMAAHGGLQVIEMGPSPTWRVRPLLLPFDYQQSLQDHVLLGFSGISRLAEQHAKAKVDNIKQGKTLNEVREIFELAVEGAKAFSRQADFTEIGKLLDQSWRVKRQLAGGVSSDWMDDLYSTAKKNGAYGGKLMGAGGGGFFFFLAPPHKHRVIQDALPQIKVWAPFKIDNTGSQVIFYNQQH